MFIDTHIHLDDERFQEDLEEVLARAQAARVSYLINVGYDLPSSRRSVGLADTYSHIYAVVGMHPHDSKEAAEETYNELRELAKNKKVVALGEMGLDYYWDNSPRDIQQQVFRQQIRLAKELKLPIVIHDRDAHGDIMQILREEQAQEVGGVLHCFSGSKEMAEICLKMNFYLSFGGPLTFKNARKLVEVVQNIPLDRILIETDCPYLTPHPFRGKRNEPSNVVLVAEKIADLRNETIEKIGEITTENARKVFRF